MDERAEIPVTLPRDNPTKSYWQDPPADIADLRTTEHLPGNADIVIIGSGLSGAAIAWNLLNDDAPEKNQSIVMLEARRACSGATGRNGGHTKAASYRSFLDTAATLGTEAAIQIATLELANIKAVHAFAQEHSIDCDLNPCDTIDIIYDEAQWTKAHEAVAAMRAAFPPGHPAADHTFHTADEVRAKFHCHPYSLNGEPQTLYGGVSYFAGSLSAYKLGIGLLKLCLSRGLNLQTQTPATDLEKQPNGTWSIQTPRGKITTSRIILATNGYTAALLPRKFQGVIVPLRGQITAHRPGSTLPHNGVLPYTYSFIYANGYEYMIPRPAGTKHAGDIVIGGGLAHARLEGLEEYGTTDDTSVNKEISEYLAGTTGKYFGEDWGADCEEGRVRMEWTGIMGYSADGFPLVGEVPGEEMGGLWMSCSFQGHGMVLCWMCARGVVEMMRIRGEGEGAGEREGEREGKRERQLRGWFPNVFRVSEERLGRRFEGRRHVAASSAAAVGANGDGH